MNIKYALNKQELEILESYCYQLDFYDRKGQYDVNKAIRNMIKNEGMDATIKRLIKIRKKRMTGKEGGAHGQ